MINRLERMGDENLEMLQCIANKMETCTWRETGIMAVLMGLLLISCRPKEEEEKLITIVMKINNKKNWK